MKSQKLELYQITPEKSFDCPPEWRQRKLTIEEAEKIHSVRNEHLGPDPIPFGFINEQGRALLNIMESDDELWEVSSSEESWD